MKLCQAAVAKLANSNWGFIGSDIELGSRKGRHQDEKPPKTETFWIRIEISCEPQCERWTLPCLVLIFYLYAFLLVKTVREEQPVSQFPIFLSIRYLFCRGVLWNWFDPWAEQFCVLFCARLYWLAGLDRWANLPREDPMVPHNSQAHLDTSPRYLDERRYSKTRISSFAGDGWPQS
jgi:hypothetical protein